MSRLERQQPGQQLSASEIREMAKRSYQNQAVKGIEGSPVSQFPTSGGAAQFPDENYWFYGEITGTNDPGGGLPIRYGLKEIEQRFEDGDWHDKVAGYRVSETGGNYALAPEGMTYSVGDKVRFRRHQTNASLLQTEPFAVTAGGDNRILVRISAGSGYGPYSGVKIQHDGGDSYSDVTPTVSYNANIYWLHSNIQPPDIQVGQHLWIYPSSVSGQYLTDPRGSQRNLSTYICIPDTPELVCVGTGWKLIWNDVSLVGFIESRDLKTFTFTKDTCPPSPPP